MKKRVKRQLSRLRYQYVMWTRDHVGAFPRRSITSKSADFARRRDYTTSLESYERG